MREIDLRGKVALVTGGSRGLGRAMVLGLAETGADAVITSRKLECCPALATEVHSCWWSTAACWRDGAIQRFGNRPAGPFRRPDHPR